MQSLLAQPTRLYGGVIWTATCMAKADRMRRVLHFIGNFRNYRLDYGTSCPILLMPASTKSKSGKMSRVGIKGTRWFESIYSR